MVPKPQSLGQTGTVAQARPAPAVLLLEPLGGEAKQVAAMAASAGQTGTPHAVQRNEPHVARNCRPVRPELWPGPARPASLATS